MPGIATASAIRNGHHHNIKSTTKMEVEKLTGKQPSHQQSLVGKESCIPGIKQSYKAVAAFYYDALSAHVTAVTLATKCLQ